MFVQCSMASGVLCGFLEDRHENWDHQKDLCDRHKYVQHSGSLGQPFVPRRPPQRVPGLVVQAAAPGDDKKQEVTDTGGPKRRVEKCIDGPGNRSRAGKK